MNDGYEGTRKPTRAGRGVFVCVRHDQRDCGECIKRFADEMRVPDGVTVNADGSLTFKPGVQARLLAAERIAKGDKP